jgi:hypothetical protein
LARSACDLCTPAHLNCRFSHRGGAHGSRGISLFYRVLRNAKVRLAPADAQKATWEAMQMRSDGPLILAVLSLAAGLTILLNYGVRAGSLNAAYPFAAANLQVSLTTAGPAAIGGLALLVLGVLLMAWAVACAIVAQFMVFGSGSGRAARVESREQKHLDREERLLEREERLKASYPKI